MVRFLTVSHCMNIIFNELRQFYLHTPRSSANGMNHTALPFQSKLVIIYRPRSDGRLSWPHVDGWLNTEINVRHRKSNPDTVAHLSTNRAPRRLTYIKNV